MTPSVGGWRKARVVALLALSAGTSGALAGFAAGVAWALAGAPVPGTSFAVAAVALTAAADSLYRWKGVPRPPSVRRQVPVLWTGLFAPETVALLYGARLGVGPLTVLPSWSWWSALVLAAARGPIHALLVAGFFGVARVVLITGLAEWARKDMAVRMGWLARQEVAVATLLVGISLAFLPILALLA